MLLLVASEPSWLNGELMPYAGDDFPNADVGEVITYYFDFTGALAQGESIAGATWTASVAPDSEAYDSSAAAIVSGAALISGNIVGQRFSGQVAGVKYLVTASAFTNLSNTLITYAHFFCETPS